MDATEGEPGGQVSLISWHSYIGIPINFHEESGIDWKSTRLNSRESPTTLSQDEKNTDVTSGMQNKSVCPKSN